MIMPLSATKPRKKCAICKYRDGEKPELPVVGVYLVEKEMFRMTIMMDGRQTHSERVLF